MSVRDWLTKREQADTAWTANLGAASGFERWIAQPGSDFVPADTTGWPVAQWTPALRDAYLDGENETYSKLYSTQPAVYTVVEFLATQIAQIGIKHYDRVSDDDRKVLSNSPVARTLRRPAPGLTYPRFMHGTAADYLVYGNAYWAMLEAELYSDSDDPWMLVPLPAAFVTPRGGSLISAEYYDFQIPGMDKPKPYPAERVVHFRRYNPDDRRIGISPLQPLRGLLREEKEAARYREVLYKTGARMAGFIKRPEQANPMDENSRKRFRAGMEKFTRGGVNEGSWMLLEEGEEPRPISFSPKDAEYLEGRKQALEMVCRVFNLPLPVLSLTEAMSYSSQREFRKALYQDTLPPITRVFEDEIDAKVLPWIMGARARRTYTEFTLEEKLRGAFEEQATMLLQAVGGPYMTRAEARARLNLPKLDDPALDELVITNNMQGTEGDATVQGGNMAPVVQLAPTQEGQQP